MTAKADETRRRILSVALTRFREDGYHKTTMRGIARASKPSTPEPSRAHADRSATSSWSVVPTARDAGDARRNATSSRLEAELHVPKHRVEAEAAVDVVRDRVRGVGVERERAPSTPERLGRDRADQA